jgi:CrcB protein
VSLADWVLVALAGAAGAPARYLVDSLVTARRDGAFPLGTFVVNVSGSLLLGFLTGLVMYHGLAPRVRVVLGTGLIGAYTTFSTFSYETLTLFEEGEPRSGFANVAFSLVVGGVAGAAGLALAAL